MFCINLPTYDGYYMQNSRTKKIILSCTSYFNSSIQNTWIIVAQIKTDWFLASIKINFIEIENQDYCYSIKMVFISSQQDTHSQDLYQGIWTSSRWNTTT